MKKTTAEKVALAQERKQQANNELQRLLQAQKSEQRKERDKRIYRRGVHIESLIDGAGAMTDEKFYKVITSALNRAGVQPPAKKAEQAPVSNPATAENEVELT